MSNSALISGLDLGQTKDFSAFVPVQRQRLENPRPKRKWRYTVRWIHTWELGTKYTQIATDVQQLYEQPQLAGSKLIPDYTGVGVAVVDLIRSKRPNAKIWPVQTHGGKMSSFDKEEQIWKACKRDLVATLQVLLQENLIAIEERIPHVDRLKRELAAYRETITRAKNLTYEADSSQHDDLVFALMLAVWFGEVDGGGDISGIGVPDGKEGCLATNAPDGVYAKRPDNDDPDSRGQ